MKKNLLTLLAALMIPLTLASCGLKGPLYFPPKEKPAKENAEYHHQVKGSSTVFLAE